MLILIDDILVNWRRSEEHEEHLRIILQLLKDLKLYAKLVKFEFWFDKVAFLCHAISKEDTEVDPKKIRVVLEWNRLTKVSKVYSFLGFLANYYRKFIEEFSRIANL